jgi:hypothetical protein
MDSKKMYLNLRNAADMPVGQDGQRDWSNNIFEYTDKGAGTYQRFISKTPAYASVSGSGCVLPLRRLCP